MLPDSTSLGVVSLRVSDVARTVLWYQQVVGVTVLAAAEGRATLGTAAGRVLLELREVPGAHAMPQQGRLGLYHHALLLPSRADLGAFLKHLESIGEPFGASDHRFSEAIYLVDPDGITLEVYADRPREEWVWIDGRVDGATEPLDARAVRAAAGGTWQGLPAGTVVGHLHFFTGDLSAAEHFYVQGLGFGVATDRFPGALFVSAGRYHHHVGLNVWAARQPVAGPQDAGLDRWELVVEAARERDAVRDRLQALGIAVTSDTAGHEAVDPWGLRVRVLARS
ncbi:MAG: VOC family protein [Candidatus Eisenbacteria bacterium]|nr:VOC family protein [Candidatus Eisenbacteria bacterium]